MSNQHNSAMEEQEWQKVLRTLYPLRFQLDSWEISLWTAELGDRLTVPVWTGDADDFIVFYECGRDALRILPRRLRKVLSRPDPVSLGLAMKARRGELRLVVGSLDVTTVLLAAIENTESLTGVRLESVFGEAGEGGDED